MTKMINRKRRTNLSRLLAGMLVGGVFLFQGTGFITGNLFAGNNENLNVTSGGTITSTDHNTGLVGESKYNPANVAGNLIINDGATAVVGVLNETSEAVAPTNAVQMTVESGYDVFIGGTAASSLTGSGTLNVFGTSLKDSTLTLEGGNIGIGTGGQLVIGGDETVGTSLGGTVWVKNGSINNSNSTTIASGDLEAGIYVGTNGELILGESADNLSTTLNIIDGGGKLYNAGQITIYNAQGSDYQANILVYEDTASANISAAGDLYLGKNTNDFSINGTVNASNLWLKGAKADTTQEVTATLASGSSVKVNNDGLLKVGDDANTVVGMNLDVKSTSVTVGGIQVVRAMTDGTNAEGGTMTVASGATVAMTGLAEKFTADGTQSADDGLYDIYLGSKLSNAGTITSKGNAGIAFSGNSAADDATVAEGLTNTGTIKTTAVAKTDTVDEEAGDLALYGSDLAGDTDKMTVASNSGTLTVAGDLSFGYDANSTKGLQLDNTGTITAASATLGSGSVLMNESLGNVTITNLTLDGGTLDAGTADSSVTTDDTSFGFTTLSLKKGNLTGVLTAAKNATITVGDADSDEATGVVLTDDTTINGTVSTAGTGAATLKLNGQGTISGDYQLTLAAVAVTNNYAGEGNSIAVKSLQFNSGASYTGNKQVSADMIFGSDSSLDLDAENRLTLAEGKTLSATDGAQINVDLSKMTDESLITLSGDAGTADLSGSQVTLSHLGTLAVGTHRVTLAKTDEAAGASNSFDATVNTSETLLYSISEGRVNDTNNEYFLDVTMKSGFSDFGTTPNQRSVGDYLDRVRVDSGNYSDALKTAFDTLSSLDDTQENREMLASLYDTLSGVNKANSLMLAMNDPWQNVFDRMNWHTHRQYTPSAERNSYANYSRVYRGQQEYIVDDGGMTAGETTPFSSLLQPAGELAPNNAWATFHHTSFNADSDGNSAEYGISRTGVTLGYDLINSVGTTAGFAFGYTQPYLYGSDNRINVSDFKLGVYGQREYWNDSVLSVYLGGGFQQYNSRRLVRNATLDVDDTYRGRYDGGSLAASVRLAKNWRFGNWTVLRPLVQFDTQQVWQQAGSEGAGTYALNWDKADWNRTFVRAGLETEVNNQFLRFTGRAIYANQIGGDDAPGMTASLIGDSTGNTMFVEGVDLGRSFLDLGIGAIGYIDCGYRWSVSGNYDYMASDNSNAHVGAVSLSYAF